MFVINWFIHQRMRANEVENRVGEALCLIDARSRSWFRYFRVKHWQPCGIRCRLLLKFSLKSGVNFADVEAAHGRAHKPVRAGCESSVEFRRVRWDLID